MSRINFSGAIFLVLCFVFLSNLNSQDVVFTQFNQSPLTLNPALTGIFNGKIRAAASYRNQWSEILRGDAYNAGSISVDTRLENDKFMIGIGMIGLSDKAGELDYGTTQGRLAFSFIRKIKETEQASHYLSIGQDLGIVERSVDLLGARWPSQHNGSGGFDPDIIVEPPGFNPEFLHLDMTTGISWLSQLKGHNRFNLGLALHHVNRSSVSFYQNNTENLSRRLTAHGGGEVSLNNMISLTPSFVYYKQNEFSAIQIGTGIRKYFSDEINSSYIDLAIQIRLVSTFVGGSDTNAIIPMLRCVFGDLAVGLSYDKPNGGLANAIGLYGGAFEMSLGYVFGNKTSDYVLPTY